MALTNVQELLQTSIGTEGSLLIPRKIADNLIMEVEKAVIPRSEAAIYYGPGDIPGSSIDVNMATPNTLIVREVGEGADFVNDVNEYTNTNIKPVKYGVKIRITKEMEEDGKFALLQHNTMVAGKKFAENENALVIAQLDTAANTVSGGAAITIANITRAFQYLRDSDFKATTFIIGNEVLNDLQNIDTFVEANKVGNTEMLTRGFLGTIYGMNVINPSTNAGMTATTSYVIDKDQSYAIAEKRTVTVEGFANVENDMKGVVCSQRIAVKALRTSSIAKITTS